MASDKMNRDAAIGLYCRLNEIDWDQEKVEQTDHFERWYAMILASIRAEATPVASITRYLYGQHEQANLNLKSIPAMNLPHGTYDLYIYPPALSVEIKDTQ